VDSTILPTVFEASRACIFQRSSVKITQKLKSTGINLHLVKKKVAQGLLKVVYYATADILPHAMTKPLTRGLHEFFLSVA